MDLLDNFHRSISSNRGLWRTINWCVSSFQPKVPTLVHRVSPVTGVTATSTFSVIIPCFNYGRFLRESVGSALAQRGADVQIIIVDDCSSDGSHETALDLAKADGRVTVLRNSANQGHVRTFNNGYRIATGDFIVRLDADDLLTDGSLARSAELFDTHPNVGLVYGHPQHFRNASPPVANLVDANWTIWRGQDWLAERCRRGFNCITTPEAVVRASVLREIGPLDERLRFAQDMDLWMRASVVSDVGRINGPDQALHRDHADSMSETGGSGIVTDLHERRAVFELVFEKMGARICNRESKEHQWRFALATEALREARLSYDRAQGDESFVVDMMSFAQSTHPDIEHLPEWRLLTERQVSARASSRRSLASFSRRLNERLLREMSYAHWTRTGL